MTITSYKRLTVMLLVFLAIAAGIAWHFQSRCAEIEAAAREAYSRIFTFKHCRDTALKLDPQTAAGLLDAMLSSPRVTNAYLGPIVEGERRQYADDIVAYLRKTTGEDLGDEPTNWVQINRYDHYWKKRP